MSMTIPPELSRLETRTRAAVFLGGAAGALARVGLDRAFPAAAAQWPWVTFAINVSGCLALAYLATRLQERLPLSATGRPLLATGLCGTYTTFSTVQIEIVTMLRHDRYLLAAGYAVASIGAGYVAIGIGTAAVRRARVLA